MLGRIVTGFVVSVFLCFVIGVYCVGCVFLVLRLVDSIVSRFRIVADIFSVFGFMVIC